MKKFNVRSLITNLLVIALPVYFLSMEGCKKDETIGPVGTKTKLKSVLNFKAYSASLTSVGLAWAASTSENLIDMTGYQITVKNPDGSTATTVSAAKGDTSEIVGSLTEGVIYTFEIIATADPNSQNYTNSQARTLKWSPARRLETEGTLPIKVYETSSPSTPSGLIFFDTATSGPNTVSVIGADTALIDVYVKTEDSNAVSLNSSHLFRAGRRITRFSTVIREAANLNNPQIAPPDTSTYTLTSLQFDSVTVGSSRIYYFKGQDGNYGRILALRNTPTNRLLWGTSPDQYLTVQISYQTVAYNPYSKRVSEYYRPKENEQ